MNFRELLAQLLTANAPDPRQGGGFIPGWSGGSGIQPKPALPELPQLPSMGPISSHRNQSPIAPMLSQKPSSDLPSYGPSPLASPIAPLGAPASSSVQGSGLPPMPKPPTPIPQAPSPLASSQAPSPDPMPTPDGAPIGSSLLSGGQDIEPSPALDAEPLPSMGDTLPGQASQMRLSPPVQPLSRNGDLVSLIQRLLHKR